MDKSLFYGEKFPRMTGWISSQLGVRWCFAWFWCFVGLFACNQDGGVKLGEEQFIAPEHATEDSDGSWLSLRDNPFVKGFINVFDGVDVTAEEQFVAQRYFSPVGQLASDVPAVFDMDKSDIGYLWSEDTIEVGTVGPASFASPSLRLPFDGEPVELTLQRMQGKSCADCTEDDPMLGFDTINIASQTIKLDTSVILIPVKANIFTEPGYEPAVSPADVEHLFEPGQAALVQLTRVNGATESIAEVEMGRFNDNGSQVGKPNPPDDVWATCGIQFRLESVDIIEQNDGLDVNLVNHSGPCTPVFHGPLLPYIESPYDIGAMPLYIGGEISVDLLDDTLAFTCAPSTAEYTYIAASARAVRSEGVIAHELGHAVGLAMRNNHSSDPADLMATPSADGAIYGSSLSEDECLKARCNAAKFVTALGRLRAGQEDLEEVECAPFAPVCGNGQVEPGEICDDGNMIENDGCRSDCSLQYCGDKVLDPGEDCELDNGDNLENCDMECQYCDACNICGNGEIGFGETCDDGNTTSGDGCSDTCTNEGPH